MALQDVPDIDQRKFIDPKTGQPYPFGSPGYQAVILPYLESILRGQMERSSNARGMFFSGPALADEQQAESELAYKMAQQGAAQSEQEQILKEEQAFQQQLQRESEQNQANLAKGQAAAGIKQSAIGGGAQGLGQLAAMKYLGGFGGHGGEEILNPVEDYNAMLSVGSTPGEAAAESQLPWYQANVPGSSVLPGAGGEAGFAGAPFSAENLGLSGLAGLAGYNIGGVKSGLPSELGGGIGGGLGFLVGGPIGAGIGAWGGKEIGDFFNHLI